MRAVFVDANETLAVVTGKLIRADDPEVIVNRDASVTSEQLPAVLGGAEIAIIDHTNLPAEIARQCRGLQHVMFLGTGARSYMIRRRWPNSASPCTSSRATATQRSPNAPSR